jgi:N-acetylglucosamine repressor
MKKATRQFTKTHNTRLILKAIYNSESISRADLSRLTHLTPATVSDLVEDLIRSGLVKEVGYGASAGGKPPILLSFDPDSRQIVSADLSGESFCGAVVNLQGEIVARAQVAAKECRGEQALKLTYDLLDDLLRQCTAPVVGIGIGTPGLIHVTKGVVRKAVNLGWHDLPLKQLLQERYRHVVYVGNDSHVAAMAEFTYGSDRESDNLILIKIGQGIGAGIVLNGEPYYGDGFGAGEIGHVTVLENGPPCTCGNLGCLETVASVRALVHAARQQAAINPDSLLHRSSLNEIVFDDLLVAYREGDPLTQSLVHQAGRYLAVGIAGLVGMLNVHHIVIAGEISRFGEGLLDAVRHELPQRVLPVMAEHTQLAYSPLGEDIVLLGAAALILAQELGLP